MLEINLLPKEYRKRGNVLDFDKKFLYVGVAAAALVVVLGGITFYQTHQMGRLEKLIAKARVEEGRYKKDIAIIDALTEVKEKILARVSAIEKLDHRRDFYIKLLEDVNTRIPEFLWMTGFSETAPSVAAAAPATAAAPGAKPPVPPAGQPAQAAATTVDLSKGTAVIEGYAHSLNAVGSFIIGLMKSDFFDDVKLSRAVAEDIGSVTAFNFKITCSLNYDADLIKDDFEESVDDELDLSSVNAYDNEYGFDYFNDNTEEQ